MDTPDAMRTRILDKAAENADFRARLMTDPKGAITQELGIQIPDSLSVEIHEESHGEAHLVLPPNSRLSESDMAAVAGGTWTAGKEGWSGSETAPGEPWQRW